MNRNEASTKYGNWVKPSHIELRIIMNYEYVSQSHFSLGEHSTFTSIHKDFGKEHILYQIAAYISYVLNFRCSLFVFSRRKLPIMYAYHETAQRVNKSKVLVKYVVIVGRYGAPAVVHGSQRCSICGIIYSSY